jgi:hypothetical protein
MQTLNSVGQLPIDSEAPKKHVGSRRLPVCMILIGELNVFEQLMGVSAHVARIFGSGFLLD